MYKAIAFFVVIFISVSVISNVLIGLVSSLILTSMVFGDRDGL